MSEADKVDNKVIGIAVLTTIVVLIAMVAGTYHLFDVTIREEIQKKVLSVESTQLRQLRVEEQGKISRYQWVNQKAGVVRVPVDRAAELILAEGYKRPLPVAPVEAPAAPVAPAANPDGGAAAAPAAPAPVAPAKEGAAAPVAPAAPPAKEAAPAKAAH